MSSSISESYVARHRATIHPLIAVAVPFLFLICLDPALRGLFPALSFPSPLFMIVALLLIGAEAAVLGNLLRAERARFLARVQELAAVLAVLWVILAAVYSVKARAFTPAHIAFAYPLALALYQWMGTLLIHGRLRERELLLQGLSGLEEEALLHALRESSLQASQALKGMKAVILATSAHLAVTVVLYGACAASAAAVPVAAYVMCMAHAVFALAVTGLMRVYGENQLLLGEGVVVSGRMEGRRTIALLVLMAMAVPVALLASRDASLLPLSLIVGLLERLAALLSARIGNETARRIAALLRAQGGRVDPLRGTPVMVQPGPMVVLFAEAVRRVLVTAIAAAAYFFIVSPLLSQEFLRALGRHGPLRFLLRKLREALDFLKVMVERLREWWKWMRSPRRTAEREPAGGMAASAPDREKLPLRKRLQSGRLIRAFLGLLAWAERRGVDYREYETLLEYSSRLLPIVPEAGSEVALVVDILEEALFSAHLVSAARTSLYFSAIKDIRKKTA